MLISPSIFSLCRRHQLRHQRSDRCRRQQRIFPPRRRLLPSHRQQRRHFRPPLDNLPFHPNLRPRHIPHSSCPPTLQPNNPILTCTGRKDLVGPSPRQRHALLRPLLASQSKAQLSCSRHSSGSCPMHRFRRDPTRQQDCFYRLSRLLHHPHIRIVRPGYWTASIHRPEECPSRPVLAGFSGIFHQCHLSAPDHLLQYHVLLP